MLDLFLNPISIFYFPHVYEDFGSMQDNFRWHTYKAGISMGSQKKTVPLSTPLQFFRSDHKQSQSGDTVSLTPPTSARLLFNKGRSNPRFRASP